MNTTFWSPTHGVVMTYKAGCRCPQCREAQRVATAEYRAKKLLHRQWALLASADLIDGYANGKESWAAIELRRVATELRRKSER